jgi:hypothetical protein
MHIVFRLLGLLAGVSAREKALVAALLGISGFAVVSMVHAGLRVAEAAVSVR